MSLISLSGASLRFDNHVLLDGADLNIAEGDSMALVGRNGCGKTTLLKIIMGIIKPDDGLVERIKGVKTAYLPQEVPTGLQGSVYDVVASGLGEIGARLARLRTLSKIPAQKRTDAELAEFEKLSHELSEGDSWKAEVLINSIIERMELNPSLDVPTISAGLKRRVLLGRELVKNPDILLLDEPTNHLDIDSVIWLEKFLKGCGKTLVFVSHDRVFLQNLATRVVEVDRGRLIAFDCDFNTFVRRRDDLLAAQERNEAVFDKKLAQEEAWLRRGVRARRTRNEGRVRELMKLRQTRSERRERAGQANLRLSEAESSGQKVLDVKNISVSFSGRTIVNNFSTKIFRGDKIGIVGRNGIGKTTLLNALLGRQKLDSGEVVYGTKLQISYFDQLREQLDPKMKLWEFVGGGADFVETGTGRQNINGYLQSFLFSPEQIRGEIAMLSGGERNRLMLAKLFASPANVLVLDEPTNDLDMETIEVLEELLVSFSGTILLVSHDRAFLNDIVTGVFCFEDDGSVTELVGGYDEWEKYRAQKVQASVVAVEASKPKKAAPKKREKFTNRERQELEELPKRIAALEAEQKEISDNLQNPDFIRQNVDKLAALNDRLAEIQHEDENLFERWSELEERRESMES